jgi:hypothetical protein
MKKWIVTGIAITAALNLWAQAPEMFRYQGRLVDGTNLVNATLPMSFKLYDSLSGGNLLYEDSSAVLVVDGLYSTMIGDNTVCGSLTNAMTNAAVYLELTVNGETLLPRERLVSVPYALNAGEPTHTHERIISFFSELDCGNVYAGFVKTNDLYISNDGDGVMTVTGLQYSDNCFSGDWSGKVRPYSRERIAVTFAPVLAQKYSGTITVICDKTSGTNTIACTGTGMAVRYVDNGDGTVTDSVTGLMWTKKANHGYMSWSSAVAYCDNLVTNGYSDWRLPSVAHNGGTAEFDTLCRVNGNPSGTWLGFEGTPFTDVIEDGNPYWSSTSYEGYPSDAYLIYMGSSMQGIVAPGGKQYGHVVWPVRGGK